MNLVGLKELAELLDVPYDTLKVWKNRDRLPEPFQVISGTPVWDWDTSEEDFRSIEKNENSGRPKKPKISIAGGLIEIDIQGSSKDKDENVSIRVNGKSFVDVKAEPSNSKNKSDRNLFEAESSNETRFDIKLILIRVGSIYVTHKTRIKVLQYIK